jgi:PAS domain S-box-containing protein
MKKNRLHIKILYTLAAISSFLILFFSILLSFFIKKTYENNIYNKLKFGSEKVAFEINKELEVNLQIIKSLSQNLSSVSDPTNKNKIDRDQTIGLLEKTIQENNNILELYTVWEKNLFDSKDSLFINETGSDSTGVFCPHWLKDNNGKITLQSFNKEGNKLYYENTKDKKHQVIFNPYTIRKNAKKVLKLPIVSPILFGNKFLGIIGINISTDWLQFYLDSRNLENQKIVIINNEGTIIGLSNDEAYKGNFFTELILEKQDEIFFDIKNGVAINLKTDNHIIIGTPFYIGETETSWHAIILYPKYKFNIYSSLILIALIFSGVILSLTVTLIFRKSLKKLFVPVINIGNLISKLEEGQTFENDTLLLNDDSLFNINQNLISIKDTFKEINIISQNITNDDFKLTMNPRNEKDILRNSINSILNKLNTDKIKSEEKENIENKSNWIKNGISLLNESIRLNTGSIYELSDIIVSTLSKYLNAMLCGFFMYVENPEGENYLEAISTYAYDTKKSFKNKVLINEGFIGACALERKTIFLTKIPDNYINISSGLGEASPRSIIILPLEFENEFIGVLEIAFLRILEPFEIEFAETVIKSISSSIKTVKINLKTNELLEKSKKQTDELAKKEAELIENLEQQKKIQQQYQLRETELKSIVNAVNNTILTIEYTVEGILLTANDKFLKTMNYTLDEIKGVNVLDLVKSEREELKQVIESASKGNFIEKVMKRYTKFGEIRWLLSTYTPFYDISGKVTKILYFAIDITENKLNTEELEKENKILNEELEITKMKLKQKDDTNKKN